jgi:hypothetical protein
MSTIKFDHSKKSFHEAIGIDEEQSNIFNKTLAEISTLIVTRERANNSMKQSEVAEILANTLSYTELLSLATRGLSDRTEEALSEFENVLKLATKKGVDFADKEAMKDVMYDVLENRKESSSSIRSIVIDPSDIDGSLDAAGIPDEIKAQLKLRILKEMRDKLSDQED